MGGSREQPAVDAKVLGIAVRERKRANEALLGREVVQAALSKLPDRLRGAWESIGPRTWISLETVERVQDAIAREAGRDPEELHDEVIRRSVDGALRTVYRIVLSVGSDEWLVSRTSAMFTRTRSVGKLSAEIVAPGRAELTLTEWPGMRDRYARQVAIGIERVLSLTGRRNVAVSHVRTLDGARFVATWEGR